MCCSTYAASSGETPARSRCPSRRRLPTAFRHTGELVVAVHGRLRRGLAVAFQGDRHVGHRLRRCVVLHVPATPWSARGVGRRYGLRDGRAGRRRLRRRERTRRGPRGVDVAVRVGVSVRVGVAVVVGTAVVGVAVGTVGVAERSRRRRRVALGVGRWASRCGRRRWAATVLVGVAVGGSRRRAGARRRRDHARVDERQGGQIVGLSEAQRPSKCALAYIVASKSVA